MIKGFRLFFVHILVLLNRKSINEYTSIKKTSSKLHKQFEFESVYRQRRCKYPRYSRLAPGSLMRARDSDNQSDGSSISPYKDGFSSSPSQQG